MKGLTKILALAAIFTLITIFSGFSGNYNYGEALQKAIYFYECQQAGPLPSWNRVEWRGDATMTDAVLGGWYDAGDHVKFNLPMSYTASMLGWAEYEYKSAIQSAGQLTYYENNLKFVLDYLAACWNGTTYTYQVGSGNGDHAWWGPVEMVLKSPLAGVRPAATASSNASCVMAQTAAALAIGYKLFNDSNYLTKAKQLYAKADADRSDTNYTAANNFYTSNSGPIDECMWAAVWLYVATNDTSYLTKAESYVSLLKLQPQTTDIEYQWAQCWDDSHYGAMLMLAKLTGKQVYKDFIHKHLDWWAAGAKGKTPGGLSWLDSWGCIRYATSAGFLAFVYSDWSGADAAKVSAYKTFAEKQVDYALGSNERNSSYVIGYGTNPPKHPHHRTAHGSWADSQVVPPNHRHTIYGALVGGPSQTGAYTDDIAQYTYTEVACDYNAGFTACLAKMYGVYGGTPLANFPSPETKDDEFFVEARVTASDNKQTDIKIQCNNRSGWPARTIKNLGFRYYMDLSEVIAAGYKASDVTVSTNYVEFPVTVSPITLQQGNIYYVHIAFVDGTNIYPGGQSPFAGEVQLRIAGPQNTSIWNGANDPSYKGIDGLTTETKTANIPVYDSNTRIFGVEPGVSPTPTPTATRTPTPTPTPTTGLKGDVNGDSLVNINDALLIAQYSAGMNPAKFIVANADYNSDGNVNINDALLVARHAAGL